MRGFRIEPGEVETALLAHPQVREAVVVAHPGTGGDKQLVAYWVAADGAAPPVEELRAFLGKLLPEYMLPAIFVPLAALPLNANDKVDRKALPAPAAAREALAGSAPPRNTREALLAEIWRGVLGLERVGIHDNFFQLGGDSILSIQVVARARKARLLITARQFFDQQTIAGLAAVAEDAGAAGTCEAPVEGEVPLTPIQRRFFAAERRQPWRFNQAVMLVPRERLAAAPLAVALARLAAHHDALRLRFPREEDGWRQIHAPAGAAAESTPLLEIELAALPREERARALDGAAAQLQWGLDLARGPLFTAALFRLGGEAGERLLLTAHHLIVDGVSWRVLLEDLTAAYRQLAAGAAPELPAKTTSWKHWAERLADFARAPQLAAAELPYWLDLPTAVLPLPIDLAGEDGSAVTATFSAELGAAPTRALLHEAPAAYRTQVNDLLLAALARAFAAWTGESTLRVDLEGHGREEIFPGADLSRTVGWFTTVFPVALALPPGAGPREAILAVKESLRAVPRRGLGCGLLRYLAGPETGERLAALPAPQVSFNYLGRFDPVVGEGGLFAFAPEVARGAEGEAVADRHLFALDLLVLDGRLRFNWTFDPGRYFPGTVERLARGFLAEVETLVAHCLSREAGGFTPSDFPLASIDQTALDRLLGNDRGVEDLYPLAPLQEGILFHSLHTGGADLYLEQLTAAFAGPFDAAAFAAAWQRLLERHAALRTAFVVAGVEQPLQLVRREVELPWTVADWRGLPAAEREARWQDLLAADRARGFDLARPPLMRLTLVRTGEESHRLVWSSHHLIFDGWCFALLLTEVFTLYEAAVSGCEVRLPAPRPYRDYIAWLAEREEEEAERFWQEVLRGFTAPTPVPFDRPAVLSGAHGSRPEDYFERKISLSAAQVGTLEALAQRLQVTLNTLVQGAWALLLSRYAQASDVVFGAVVSGRPAELPGVESMVGLFINTLPVRVEIPEGEATSGWLARLQASQFEQRQYQWTPLARVQTLAGLAAGESLFASLLVFANYPVDAAVSARLGELRIADVELGERTNYPLTLTVVARGDLTLRLIADRRFEPPTVQRMLGHLERFLAAFAAHPERSPRSLPFLSAAERHQLTVDWRGAPPRHPRAATVHGLFAAQAARTPGAVAVVCGDEELTYADLAVRSRRLAGRLLALHLPPESRIAIVAERSPALIVGLLGILQAGGAYLPLDPELPSQRLAFLLADAGATVLLGEREALDSLPADLRLEGVRVLASDDEEEGGETPLLPEVAATDLAYVLYTSGSTGTPKGVAVPHRGVVRLVIGADWADLGPGETFLQLCHLTFDVSAFEIWAPLLNGGRLALYPGRRPSLDELAAVIARHGVTTMWLTSGLFHQMVDERLDGLRPLRQLVAGGDVLSPPHVRRALAGLPGCILIDGYGPTENSILTTSHAMTAADLEDERLAARVPIGRAVRGTEVYVLGADLQPVPVGVWGELAAGGDGVARCYLGRPDLTATAFVPDPFAEEPGARLYRTGDVVRWRSDGVLELLGRRDGQVKVRGIRIELGEIEAALVRQPGVREAVVLVREDTPGDRRLVAYVVSASEPEPSPAHLREALRRSLPEPMVPTDIIALESLPLTANGKVDRRALARIAPLAVRQTASYTVPQGLREEMLAAIWAEVLGPGRVERVGAHDDFFTLGGHSLLATQVISRLREAFGVELPVRALFEAPTVWALAARIGQESGGPQAPPLVRVPREGDLPLSFAQQRLWFLDQLAPGNPFYNMFGAVRLTGTLEIEALRQACREIVRRHEALRTSFPLANGRPFQAIAPAADFQLPRIDMEALSGAVPEQCLRNELARLAGEESRRPFDLVRGSLLRVHLIRLGPREHTLLVNLHHIVSDGWSMDILFREIATLYGAFSGGAPSPLPELPIQYADFAVWQRGWLQGERLEAELEYWRRQLDDIPEALELPFDHPRPAVESFRGGVEPFALPAALVRGMSALTRRSGATLSMTMLAGFQSLLGRYAGRDDVATGMAIANRTRREVEGLIGFFVNTLVVRSDLSGSPGFAPLLARVRETALAAYAHQDLPFERLVEELQPERALNRNPLIQVMVGYQNFPQTAMEVSGLVLSPPGEGQVAATTAKFDLALFVFEDGDRLHGVLEYSSDLFAAATIRRLLFHYENLLAAAVAAPETAVELLPLLAAAERHQLVREWNDTGSVYPAAASLQELFEAHVRSAPHAPALTFCGEGSGEGALSYGALNRRANRLAHRLLSLGAGPESRIGLAFERSPEMVVGLLGILKAGGAYVPLDADYPPDRLAFMVDDSGLRLIVADAPTAARLPAPLVDRTRLVILAHGSSAEDGFPAGDPPVTTEGSSLALVIYTSGSTGRPKGVALPHRGVARLVRETNYAHLGPGDRVGQTANISFDAATWEIWGALLNGAELVVIPRETVLSTVELAAALRQHRLTSLFLTTALFMKVAAEMPDAFRGLRELMFGGETVVPAAARAVLAAGPPCRLLHAYGPAESTTYASWHPILAVPPGAVTIPIGRPVANTSLYVMDRRQSLVPEGAVGELCIGGDGLARGYWRRPELTAELFLPHPWEDGGRLYRTGDLVRIRPDGCCEFLGRIDHQVKIRGFRIEPGEIELRLGEHPAVLQNVVLAREDVPGDRRLVAYVVQNPAYEAPESGVQSEHVSQWGELFDDIYRQEAAGSDPTFNVIGWNSTYTDLPLPRNEMADWLEDTIRRIQTLAPRRVLEIGCGTGMILFRIAPCCELYVGADVSGRALAYIDSQLDRVLPAGERSRVQLVQGSADQLPGMEADSFDTVILNSVAQYFPSADYLAAAVTRAVEVVRPGGAIFLGDLRSLPLLAAFHTSLELFQAEPDMPLQRLRQKVQSRRQHENELAIDPAFFAALSERLPKIGRVEVYPKQGRAHNELTCFRYQVVLEIGDRRSEIEAPISWLDWRLENLTVEALRRRLAASAPAVLGVRNVPNARVAADVAAVRLLREAGEGSETGMETVWDLRRRAAAAAAGAVEPQDLWDLALELPYEVELSWADPGSDGSYEALFVSAVLAEEWEEEGRGAGARAAEGPLSRYTNNPLQGRFARRIAPELRTFLKASLPDYLIPSSFVLLDALPFSPSGKVDRRRLPVPDDVRTDSGQSLVAPRNATEQKLLEVWRELLGIERLGVEDDFFALGGHSLLATQAVSRVREAFGVELPLRTFFEAPTVAAVATAVAGLRLGDAAAAPPIVPVPRDGALPLSFAQERLWFLDRLMPGSGLYTLSNALRLQGALDQGALARALAEVSRRHESLRTTFPEVAGRPVQAIAPPGPVPLPVVDLTGLPVEACEREGLAILTTESRRPFDLASGPLLRCCLVLFGEGDSAVLLRVHHTVCDGWSMGLLTRELTALYRREAEGVPADLPELPVQVADHAVWQRRWLSGETLDREVAWWRERLAGIPATIELPTDRPRPAEQSLRGGRRPFSLPAALATRLAGLARREGSTLFMLLLASLDALLHRYGGQSRIAVGTPIANRGWVEIEPLIGNFANTMVLTVEVEPGLPFRKLLGRAQEAALGAYAHQDVPFELLVEALNPQRDLSRNPLFQVLLGLHNLPQWNNAAAERMSFRALPIEGVTARFDLALDLLETPGGLHGELEYAADLFDAATVERLAGHLANLLSAAAVDPDVRVGELPLLGRAERHQLQVEWNDASSAGLERGCLHSRFALWARRRPEAVAVVCGEERVTYGALWRRALRLAGRLRRRGVGPGVLVGLCAERSVGMIEGILGVLAAGGAYVPLDPSYPRLRLESILEQTRVPVVVTQSTLVPALPESGAEVVLLDAPEEGGEAPLPEEATIGDGRHLAYVIFTSGSTGRPKGVLVPHAGAVHLVERARERVGFGPEDVWTVVHSFAFDFSVWEIWGALTQGGTLVVVPLEAARSPERLAELVRHEGVTVLDLTPSAARALAAVVEAGSLPSLRRLVCGGESFPRELADRLLGWGVPLWAFYGPTEATVWAAAEEVTAKMRGGGSVPLGWPLADHRLHVLTAGDLEPAPAGVPGELHIAGPGLAWGYFGDSALTAQRFVPNPFPLAGEPGARLYRTGDLARRLPDGTLDFLGRIDQQVKVRGFRIELGEIEVVLAEHPGVAQAVVTVIEGAGGEPVLAAWLVAREGETVTAEALRQHVAMRLPAYMVPVAFRFLAELPRSANGKIDRRALSSLGLHSGAGDGSSRSAVPRDTLELRLAILWEELLGRDVGVADSFFDLGGNSMLAVRLMTRIRAELGRELPISALFRLPTVEKLASALRSETAIESRVRVDLATGGPGRPLFLVHPIGGSVFCYAALARRIGADRPIFALQSLAPHDGAPDLPDTIEAFAARYLEEVRAVQPRGPYILGGWSMGGVVALEMARRLTADGEAVELLALIDPSLPEDGGTGEESEEALVRRFAHDLAGIHGRSLPAVGAELSSTGDRGALCDLFDRAQVAGLLPPDIDYQDVYIRFEIFRSNLRALRNYELSPWDGPAVLIAALRPAGSPLDLVSAWTRALGERVAVRFLAGSHYDLLQSPTVETVAAILRDRLGVPVQIPASRPNLLLNQQVEPGVWQRVAPARYP